MRYARRTLSLILGTLLVLTTAVAAATTPPPVAIPWEQSAATSGGSSVTYGDEHFVAVDGAGAVRTSTDGINWRVVHEEPPPSGVPGWLLPQLHAVTYGEGRFVAVGNPWFRVLTSTDGTTWSASEQWTDDRAQGYRQLADVTFGNGRFVAVGTDSAGASETVASTDGVQWSHSKKFPGVMLHGVAFDGHRFLAVGETANFQQGGVWESADGITWTAVTVALPPLGAVVYSAGRFVAVGAPAGEYRTYSFTSTDGTHWERGSVPGVARPQVQGGSGRLSFAGGYYWLPADGTGAELLNVSRDGLNWTETSPPGGINYVAGGGDRLVAAGRSGAIFTLSLCGGFLDLSAKDAGCKAVTAVQAAHAITGYPDGTFRPAGAVSRAEFAKMLTLVLGKAPAPGGPLAFTDTRGHWAADQGYLQTALAAHAIAGYPDGTFRPNAKITRAELVKMVSAAAGMQPSNAATYYSDVALTDWFYAPVTAAARARLIGPNAVTALWPGPTLQPDQAASRAEAATLLANLIAIKQPVPPPSASAWTLSTAELPCGTDPRLLRGWIEHRPGATGQLSLFLHNNTKLCGAAGAAQTLTGSTLQLGVEPLRGLTGDPAGEPAAPVLSLPIADVPPQLAPGQQAARTVAMSQQLPPGWYTAKLTGAVAINGERYSFDADERARDSFMVTAAAIQSGRSTKATSETPAIAGVTLPFTRAEWGPDSTTIYIQASYGCTGDRDRAVSFTLPRAIAQGQGFETQLPYRDNSGDDKLRGWMFGPMPGESRTLVLRGHVTVSQCQRGTAGSALASDFFEWVIPLR